MMSYKHIYILIFLYLSAASCTYRPAPASSPQTLSEVVGRTLSRAAEESHANLALIAKLRSTGMTLPTLPPSDDALRMGITMHFTGPASTALAGIALHVKYQFVENGRERALELPVIIDVADKQVYSVLEDIAWQIYPQAEIRLDTVGRVITLGGGGN